MGEGGECGGIARRAVMGARRVRRAAAHAAYFAEPPVALAARRRGAPAGGAPVGGETRWLNGLDMDEPEERDVPQRFFRW